MIVFRKYVSIASFYALNLKRDKVNIERYTILSAAIILMVLLPFIVLSILRFDYSKGDATAEEIFVIIFLMLVFVNLIRYSKENKSVIHELASMPLSLSELCITAFVIRLLTPLNWPIYLSILITVIYIANNIIHFLLLCLFSLIILAQITLFMQITFLLLDIYKNYVKKLLENILLPLCFLLCIVFSIRMRNSTATVSLPLPNGKSQILIAAIFSWQEISASSYLMITTSLMLIIALQYFLYKWLTAKVILK